jgi:hypothetical protein
MDAALDGVCGMRYLKILPALAVLGCALAAGGALAGAPPGLAAPDRESADLLARHEAMAAQLAHNEFGRPIALASQEEPRRVSGDVYAELDSPFATVSKSFADPRVWCDVLILHINTKSCRTGAGAEANQLSVRMGRKKSTDPEQGFALRFAFDLQAARARYLSARLSSPSGPLGSRDYQIELQAVPLPGRRSFIHLHYAYSFGSAARLATEGYLATGGSGKLGFTRTTTKDGTSGYVGGMRGAIERNTMRYYLAVACYLDSLAQPPGRQFSSRIEHWFDATEQYRAQLHELGRAEYLSMKQHEYAHQQDVAVQPRAAGR